MSESRMLTDHDEIRKWVEARGGRPARVKGTGDPLPDGPDEASGEGSDAKGKKAGGGKAQDKKAGGAKSMKQAASDLDAGLLRIDFQEPDDRLESVDWEMFFATFEERKLALLCGTAKDSRFNKLVKREA